MKRKAKKTTKMMMMMTILQSKKDMLSVLFVVKKQSLCVRIVTKNLIVTGIAENTIGRRITTIMYLLLRSNNPLLLPHIRNQPRSKYSNNKRKRNMA